MIKTIAFLKKSLHIKEFQNTKTIKKNNHTGRELLKNLILIRDLYRAHHDAIMNQATFAEIPGNIYKR